MSSAAIRKKMILFLGKPEMDPASLREAMIAELAPVSFVPTFVFAKDGADAASKTDNQKFDAVVIDTAADRLEDSGFVRHLRAHKHTSGAGVVALVPDGQIATVPTGLHESSHVLKKPCSVEALVRALAKALIQTEQAESKPAGAGKFAVDVRVLNALIKATFFVVGQFGLSSLKPQKPEIKTGGTPWRGDIAAMIDLNSKVFQGALVISFDKSLYFKLLSNMLGEEHSEINAENRDAIGEVANMVLGNAKSDITDYGIALTLPRILNVGEAVACPSGSAGLILEANCEGAGKIYIEILAYARS